MFDEAWCQLSSLEEHSVPVLSVLWMLKYDSLLVGQLTKLGGTFCASSVLPPTQSFALMETAIVKKGRDYEQKMIAAKHRNNCECCPDHPDCQPLTLNVMIRVSQLVSESQLCH